MREKWIRVSCNLGFVVVAGVLFLVTQLALGLWIHASRATDFVVLDRVIGWTPAMKQVLGMTAILMGLILCLLPLVSGGRVNRPVVRITIICLPLTIIVAYVIYDVILVEQGVGTIRSMKEIELWQEDLTLRGELGIYGAYLETEDTTGTKEEAYFICREVDVYGPFSYPVLSERVDVSFASGEELFAETVVDGQMMLKSLTLREYDDGYWAIVKQFVSAEDVRVEIEHIEDLRRYATQAEYHLHREAVDAATNFSALRQDLGDLTPN